MNISHSLYEPKEQFARRQLLAKADEAAPDDLLITWSKKTAYQRRRPRKSLTANKRTTEYVGVT